MLQIPTWSRIVTVVILLAGLLIALPNALPSSIIDRMPQWLPTSTVALGLDLQGGASLLLQVEVDQAVNDRLESLKGDFRTKLRKAIIGYDHVEFQDDTVSVHILDPQRFDDAKNLLEGLNPPTGGSMLSVGQRAYEVSESGGDVIAMKMTEPYKTETRDTVVNQSIEVVRRRIDQLGTREPLIERQGEDRIVVQVPGLNDPSRLVDLLGKTAKMTFQMVDETASPEQAVLGIVPIGSQLLYEDNSVKGQPPSPIVVERHVVVAGDRLVDAKLGYGQGGDPVVEFNFDTVGAREFGEATKDNVGRHFAIVLDGKVISAPVIKGAILGGSGVIEGSFTVQSAGDLAALLRAGALPVPLKVIEQRTVGSSLGADQIAAGKFSTLAGLALVAVFMVLRYGLFGLFADIALTMNVILLLALLTALGATLTLPGIAGIVLTMGMAVDANVLIYERIREETRNGRSIIASIDQGFRRAMATIFDANMTHLIASLILFQLGSGPVRGFAVALGLGIVTSFFTAVMVTRLMVVTWFEAWRPKQLAL
ncbi:MAG TPA: protein translocase subunit SecD [Rhizomicrobium sp.]|nr:protein translocase subunit SecD [Rhizomicrobium sp.]